MDQARKSIGRNRLKSPVAAGGRGHGRGREQQRTHQRRRRSDRQDLAQCRRKE